jgi:outer membrane lipoprotein-sorting protein
MTGKCPGAGLLVAAMLFVLQPRVSAAGEPARPEKLIADFTMKRTLKVLTDTITSSGRLTLGGPGLLRWETMSPGRSVLVINRTTAWIHYPEMDFTRDFNISDDPVMKLLCEHLSALTVQDFDKIREIYEVQDVGEGIKKLVPKGEGLKAVFRQLRVKIDEKGIASRVEITSTSGDVTLIEFENVQINPLLSPELFEKPPGG